MSNFTQDDLIVFCTIFCVLWVLTASFDPAHPFKFLFAFAALRALLPLIGMLLLYAFFH